MAFEYPRRALANGWFGTYLSFHFPNQHSAFREQCDSSIRTITRALMAEHQDVSIWIRHVWNRPSLSLEASLTPKLHYAANRHAAVATLA